MRILDGRLKDVHCFVVNPDKNQRGSRYLAAQWSSPISTDRNLGPLIPPYSHPISHGFESETVDMDQMSSGSRSLAGGVYYTEAELCREYFLSYSVFCAFMLTLFLTALLIVSEVYMRRVLDKVLEMEIDLEWQDVEEVEEEESFILQEAEQFEKEIEQTQEKTKTTDASFTSISPMNSVPSIDAAPLTFSLLLPTSTPSSPTRNTTPPAFTPIWSAQSAPHSSDYIPNPSPTSNATFPAHVPIPIPAMTPYSVPLHSRRARSVTSPDPYDEKFLNYRSKIHAIGKGRAQSMNRGRSHTVNFGLPDSQMRRESMAVSPSTSDSAVSHSRSRSVTMAVTGALGIGVDAVSPRLPPQSVIQEHEQQMKEMERIRGRSNTFIQYMSDSLPVTLLNSRYDTVRPYFRIVYSTPIL